MSANNINERSNSDSALDIDMAEVDISFGSSGCSTPSPRSTSTPSTAQRHFQHLLRTAEADDTEGFSEAKHINDNIHGHILVPPECQAIIDTPQFDR